MTLGSMPECNQDLAEVNTDYDTDKIIVCIKLLSLLFDLRSDQIVVYSKR